MKKLKKAHIWPSVLFLVLSTLIMAAAVALFSELILAYFTLERVQDCYEDCQSISRMFEGVRTKEEREKILNYLEQDSGQVEAVYLLDESGEAIAGFGGRTYIRDSRKLPLRAGDYVAYLDEDSLGETIFDEEMDIDLSVPLRKQWKSMELETFKPESRADLKKIIFDWQKTISFEEKFWLGKKLPNNESVIVKCKIYFYYEDFMLAALLGLFILIVTLLPVLLLFINLLINIFHQRWMTKMICTDQVTGGDSWAFYEQRAHKLLYAKRKSGKVYAVVNISLMKYRSYCICHGVKAGELLLQSVDKYLRSCKNRKELCAHYEKSDFALLLICEDRESGEKRVRELLEQLPGVLKHENLVFHAGIYFIETKKTAENSISGCKKNQINVAEYYNRACSARASIADDKQAMAAVFDQKLLEKQLWEHRVEEKMQQALEKEEFQVYIQPKYDPVTEKLAGAEALVRWINEEDGFVPPGKFIPIFEENGFIVKLDDYMISHVAKLQAQWLAEGREVVPISVNVSRAHFANPDLAQHICRLVDAYQVPHHLIEIELTESAFFDDKEALLNTVRKLKEMGFDISMDDFGAGYSSLNSLKDLPLDVLKLDAEFFRGEDGMERGEIVVTQAINLAKQLNMRIVAEGVEKKNQVEFLAAQNCDMIQGFYYAKPMPAGEYEQRLEKKEA